MPSVLIIDDEMAIRAFLSEVLEDAGYDVEEAADGQEGLECYRKSPADLVITDLFMKGHEGLEMIFRLRREFPDAKVIAMSGGGGEYDDPEFFLNAARTVGATETLYKPLAIEELLNTVRKVLEA